MKIPHPALGKKFCTSGEFRLAKNNEDKEVLFKHAQGIVSNLILDFGAVYLLGASGKYCVRVLGEI
jgi:hypothetical protein